MTDAQDKLVREHADFARNLARSFARRTDPNSRNARAAYARGEKHLRKTRDGKVVEVAPIKVCELREDMYGTHDDLERSVIQRLDLLAALRAITRREAYVLLRAAVGYDGGETAAEMRVSESRVSQIRKGAARKVARLVSA